MEKYHLIQQEEHLYTMDVQKNEDESVSFTLRYSNSSDWATPNAVILTAVDSGDDISVGAYDNKAAIDVSFMPYDVAEELGLLLRFMSLFQTGDLTSTFAYTVIKQEIKNTKI